MNGLDEHAYFLAIEEAFIRLRGAPLLLSPADWQVAAKWQDEGIPLDLVLDTLAEIFARRAERGEERGVQSLRYCRRAVESAWKKRREITVTGERREPSEFDPVTILAQLALAIPAMVPRAGELAERIRALEGGSESVEGELAALDLEMVESVERSLDDASSAELDRAVDDALARLTDRIGPEEAGEARSRLRRQILRRQAGLPILTLFGSAPRQD